MKWYRVVKVHWGGAGPRVTLPGKHRCWPRAWRRAAKLNKQVRERFLVGEILYDIPEFQVEEITP